MNNNHHAEVPCSICGAEHDPNEAPEADSTHLCASCASAQRALRHRNAASSASVLVAGDAE